MASGLWEDDVREEDLLSEGRRGLGGGDTPSPSIDAVSETVLRLFCGLWHIKWLQKREARRVGLRLKHNRRFNTRTFELLISGAFCQFRLPSHRHSGAKPKGERRRK